MLHGLLFALSFIAGGYAVREEALLRSKIDAATLTWQIGMDEGQVEGQIGKPRYVTIEQRGGFAGGPVQIGQTIMNLPAVPVWTAKVGKYYAEATGDYFRKRHFFEVVYHQSLNGTWGLDGWKWGFEYVD
jgi:hypothetical protein